VVESTVDRVRAVVEPVVVAADLELYDVELAGGVLRVLVDAAGGVDLGVLGEVTRAVSEALDADDPLPGRYTLEVSSPGLERKLRTPAHFAAALGKKVRVRTVAGTEGERRIEGEVAAADDDGVVLATPEGERRIAYDEVERAKTVFEWGPTPPPGSGKRRQKRGREQVEAGAGGPKRRDKR
jgi:ribosome maturation factor RimP